MQFTRNRTGILSVMTAIFLIIQPYQHEYTAPVDILKDLPQLSSPLSAKKLVIAHFMPAIIRYKGHKLEDSCDPAFYSPDNNISSPLGGLTQVKVMSDEYLSEVSLDEAVEFEMRAAL